MEKKKCYLINTSNDIRLILNKFSDIEINEIEKIKEINSDFDFLIVTNNMYNITDLEGIPSQKIIFAIVDYDGFDNMQKIHATNNNIKVIYTGVTINTLEAKFKEIIYDIKISMSNTNNIIAFLGSNARVGVTHNVLSIAKNIKENNPKLRILVLLTNCNDIIFYLKELDYNEGKIDYNIRAKSINNYLGKSDINKQTADWHNIDILHDTCDIVKEDYGVELKISNDILSNTSDYDLVLVDTSNVNDLENPLAIACLQKASLKFLVCDLNESSYTLFKSKKEVLKDFDITDFVLVSSNSSSNNFRLYKDEDVKTFEFAFGKYDNSEIEISYKTLYDLNNKRYTKQVNKFIKKYISPILNIDLNVKKVGWF